MLRLNVTFVVVADKIIRLVDYKSCAYWQEMDTLKAWSIFWYIYLCPGVAQVIDACDVVSPIFLKN